MEIVMLVFTSPFGTMLAEVPDLQTCQQLGLTLLAQATADGVPAGFSCISASEAPDAQIPMG